MDISGYAARWRVEFKDLASNTVTVEILADGWEGSVTALTADESPLTTDWDDDKDMLSPVRTGSGTLKVRDEGNLQGIMPAGTFDRLVRVSVGNSVRWLGFIQPQQFSREMFLPYESATFGLSDLLGVLGSIDMEDAGDYGVQTFGALLLEAMDQMDGLIDSVMFPAEWGRSVSDTDKCAWLDIAAQRMNFYRKSDAENEDDADYTKYERKSYLQLLEEIMKVMGWTAMLDGSTLSLMDAWETDYRKMTLSQLRTAVGGGAVAYETVTIGTSAMGDYTFAALKQQQKQYPGYRRVRVSADSNPFEESNVEMIIDGSYPYLRQRDLDYNHIRFLKELVYQSKQGDEIYLYNAGLTTDSMNIGRVDVLPYDPTTDAGVADVNHGYVWCQVARMDFYTIDDLPSKLHYEFTDGVFVGLSVPAGDYGTQKVRFMSMTSYIPAVTSGCFDLQFDINTMSEYINVTNCALTFKLEVGGKYWDGTSWTTTESTFEVNIIDGSNEVTKTLSDGYADASGYVIPITGRVGGDIHLDVSLPITVFRQYAPAVMIRNLTLTFCDLETSLVKELRDTNAYTASKQTGYEESKTIELSMTTKTESCKNGYGILYLDNNQLGENNCLYKDGTAQIPEKALLAMMRKAYFVPTVTASPTVRTASWKPLQSLIAWDGALWAVRGGEYRWRDAEWEVDLFKIEDS